MSGTGQPDLRGNARRRFLARLTAGVLSPGVLLTGAAHGAPRSEPVSGDQRWGMLIDTQRCAEGCRACVDACDQENGLDRFEKPAGQSERQWQDQRPRWIRGVKVRDNLTGRVTSLPMMCQHCEHPPCVDVCPTGASFRRADGVVMVDRHTCIGCRYCMVACPFEARAFIHEDVDHRPTLAPRGKGCVESCNLCAHRLDRGESRTACQDACDAAGHKAILFGDLKDPDSEISKALAVTPAVALRDDLQLNPGVRYAGL